MSGYIILDLDNCIADDAWRIPRINWDASDMMVRYHDYHALSAFDKAANTELFDGRQSKTIIFTARPVLYRPITVEWLRRIGLGNYNALIMRNNDDHRSSIDLKRSMLHWLPELYGVKWNQIEFAYDDRPDIVDVYRKYGLAAYVRSIHDVCAYTKPKKEVA